MMSCMRTMMLHKPLTTLTIWPTTVIRTLTRATSTKRRDRTTLLSPSPVFVDPKLHKEALLISSVSHTTRVQNPLCNLHSIPQRKYENQNCQEVSRIWPSGAQNFSTYTKSKSKPCAIFHLPIRLATSFGYQYRVTSPVLSNTHQGRSSHTSAETSVKLESGQTDDHQSVVVTGGERSLVIPAVWLRDHCMSERYFNHETQQKNVDPDLLASNLKIDSVGLTGKDNSVRIAWNDGHISEFAKDWLLSNYYQVKPSSTTGQLYWDRELIESQPLPVVSHVSHMTSESGLAMTISNLRNYGFSIVEGADATEDATEEVVRRVTFVQETLFGKMWTFTADAERSDTAYSTQALGSHTDLTYMNTPAGIQVFHCLKHTGKGGETLLVDGFHSMELLRQAHPEDFELLSRTEVPHQYKEEPSPASPGYHLYSLGTVVRTHPTSSEFIQLRYNPYDRAPLNTIPAIDIPAFYRAYSRLSSIISDPAGQFWLKLKPGQVLFIDNWRVMHGRAAFDGARVMCGCYLPRDEWVSKARMLGVW